MSKGKNILAMVSYKKDRTLNSCLRFYPVILTKHLDKAAWGRKGSSELPVLG